MHQKIYTIWPIYINFVIIWSNIPPDKRYWVISKYTLTDQEYYLVAWIIWSDQYKSTGLHILQFSMLVVLVPKAMLQIHCSADTPVVVRYMPQNLNFFTFTFAENKYNSGSVCWSIWSRVVAISFQFPFLSLTTGFPRI